MNETMNGNILTSTRNVNSYLQSFMPRRLGTRRFMNKCIGMGLVISRRKKKTLDSRFLPSLVNVDLDRPFLQCGSDKCVGQQSMNWLEHQSSTDIRRSTSTSSSLFPLSICLWTSTEYHVYMYGHNIIIFAHENFSDT